MKRVVTLILVLCALLSCAALPAQAYGSVGYDISDPDAMIGKRICNFDYSYYKNSKYPNYQPYQKRYIGSNPQCVGYAYARIEEKLNLDGVGFSSGAGANDMPANAAKVDGKVVHSSSGEEYTIRVHRNDGGAYLA